MWELLYAHSAFLQSMSKFLEDAQNPEFQHVLEQAFRELGTDGTDMRLRSEWFVWAILRLIDAHCVDAA